MDDINSERLQLHRFLAMTVSHSTTVDPRHLEHHIYPYWTADFAALILSGELSYSLVAPQFPVYVSPKEISLGPNVSNKTQADGEAEGVYVDIAIVMPVVQPRYSDELGTIGPELVGHSLSHFFDEFEPHLRGFAPRCLWVSGHEAAVLGELKPGPTRHTRKITYFIRDLNNLLEDARLQAQAQALCLFCSWRFGTQHEVLLLAGAGEYYQICRVTRKWSAGELRGESYSSETLKNLKAAAKEDQVDLLGEDGDWTEGQEKEMYGDPRSAQDRKNTLNRQRGERAQRAQKRAPRAEQLADVLNVSPSTDRTTPRFSHDALNDLHRITTDGDLFFESEDPEKYFSVDSEDEPLAWSRVLHLGSDLSNQYMTRIQAFIRTFEEREAERRNNVFFETRPPAQTKTPKTKVQDKVKGKAKDESKEDGKADRKAKPTKDKKRR
ncbi:hypothetical protein B0H12DRAFT_162240 [Mycena haematopus]|nr:hypothetical protein B0H12DRAFT_162240 [Mycena haematopus]